MESSQREVKIGLFDLFTGTPAKEAAAKNAALYQQFGQQATGAINRGTTQGANALQAYLQQGEGAVRQGQQGALGVLPQYAEQAAGQYAPLSALGTKYGTATTAALDALGVNGPEAAAAARARFQTGPGYQFQVDEATKAAAAKAASLGLAGSGNAMDEIRNRAQGVASGEWNNYLSNLLGFTNPELQATSGAASGRAGVYGGLGRGLADIYTGTGSNLASLYGGTGNQLANLYSGAGTNTANIMGNVAAGTAQANQQAAQAQLGASQNFWNTLAGLGGAFGPAAIKKWG